jgi:ABC-type phosphate/phosphonate transport system ATPase subunit
MKKQTWSVEEIATQIHAIARECASSHNDGFTAFELKKDLYQIKEILETAINQSPTFYGEHEWLTEQEKKRIIKILKS